MYHRRDDFGADFGSAIAVLGLILLLIAAFLVVKAVLFVVRTFVKYHRLSLWIALVVCISSFNGSVLLYKLTAFDGSFALSGIGIVVLLLTCLVVDLKNRDTLMRENVNLIDEVLHKSWLGEDTPLELENEQLAA